MSRSSIPSLRREFLRFLAGSPIAAVAAMAQDLQPAAAPASPKEVLSIMDFEPLARKSVPIAHWGYLATGVDDDLTLRINHEAMAHYQLRARLLTGLAKADLSTDVFGVKWDMPVYATALASQRAFHPEGELGTARAAKARHVIQMLSTNSSTSVEDVAGALGQPPWYQLYMPPTWAETEKLVKRVEKAGCPVLVWTIDTLFGRNAETGMRAARLDKRECLACHPAHPISGPSGQRNRKKPMFDGLSGNVNPVGADWTYVDRLKKLTPMKVLLKGIDTAEDAVLAKEHGADGIVVSNHGGRATETGRATIDILPEVVDAVGRGYPVFVDGGFRRGTDVLKALALGARAVGVGRPYVWGLSAFGQQGVERVFEILRTELDLAMRQCGIASVAQATRAAVLRNGVKL